LGNINFFALLIGAVRTLPFVLLSGARFLWTTFLKSEHRCPCRSGFPNGEDEIFSSLASFSPSVKGHVFVDANAFLLLSRWGVGREIRLLFFPSRHKNC